MIEDLKDIVGDFSVSSNPNNLENFDKILELTSHLITEIYNTERLTYNSTCDCKKAFCSKANAFLKEMLY